jgi:hypothetical protein
MCVDDEGTVLQYSLRECWNNDVDFLPVDFMTWDDILFNLRKKSKLKFDGFGEFRSEDEAMRVKATLHVHPSW